MTLNTTYSPAVADGNGVTTNFSYSFDPISISYLKVSLEINGVWVQQLSGWTATTSPNGGIVTFATAPTTRVAIERDVPEEQPTSYETSSGFQAKVIENSFDMLTGMVQELKEASERSVKVDVGSSTDPDAVVRQVDRVYQSIDNVDAVADDLLNVDTLTADLTNVDIVAGSITNVNKVGNDITNVNAVATNETNVNTVASNILDVNTVASDMTNVSAVGNDLTNIDAVANNQTNIDTVAGIDSDVSSVAGIKNDVSTVSGISSNVTSVAGNSTNINTVAGDISNVNTVGGSITNVNKVANKIADVSTVAGDLTDIGTVATNIADVNAVGGSIANVNSVASDLTNVDAVAGNKTNIDTVAGISGNVTTVAGISSAVGTVAGIDDEVVAVSGNATNINTVGSNIGNVNSVAGNISNVNAVASNETNINAVNANKTNINTVAGISGDVTSVANNGTNVTAVASNETNINAVNANKTNINAVAGNSANINSVATNIANVNTVAGDHANIQTVINNMTAINNAPTYANNSKIWAEGLDGEVAPLGGTHSSKGWAQIAEAAASGVQNPANRDLSNLTTDGQMIIDSQNGTISNCILEIPQNVKIEIVNNVPVIKAGSTFVLTGTNTYSTYTNDSDVSVTSIPTGKFYLITYNYNGVNPYAWITFDNCLSESSAPTTYDGQHTVYFCTDDKNYYIYQNDNWIIWRQGYTSYPIAAMEKDAQGNVTFLKDSNGNDMIFNGAGFIGHHAFVYPNVKALLPAGFNEDGSLKSREITTNNLQIIELSSQSSKSLCFTGSNQIGSLSYTSVKNKEELQKQYIFQYCQETNSTWLWSNNAWQDNTIRGQLASYTYDGTTVTKFDIGQPYEGAANLLTDELQADVTTLTGYDSTQTQTLKNINGVLQWVTD